MRPPARNTASQWADENRVMVSKNSPEPGPWRTSRVPYTREIMDTLSDPMVRNVVWMAASQVAKALALDTPLPTPDGWTTMGDLRVGDSLYDERGKPCRVTFATEVQEGRSCFLLRFSDGSEIVADESHLWYVESDSPLVLGSCWTGPGPRNGVLTTRQICGTAQYYAGKARRRRNRYAVPVAGPLEGMKAELPVHPYALGLWLGDGHSYSTQFTVHESAIELVDRLRETGLDVFLAREDRSGVFTFGMSISRPEAECRRGHNQDELGRRKGRGGCSECSRQHSMAHQYGHPIDPVVHWTLGERLRDLHLLKSKTHPTNEKHIPRAYLRSPVPDRMELLRGLMDTDGTIGKNGWCSYTSTSRRLADDVYELIASLGFKPTFRDNPAKLNGRLCGTAYQIGLTAYNDRPVFTLRKKLGRMKSKESGRVGESGRRRIVAVEPVGSVPVRCIQVDSPASLFLAGRGMIPTHNTEVCLNFLGSQSVQDPGPMMVVLPTDKFAGRWSINRLDPMINASPALRARWAGARSRTSANTRMHKEFTGGHLIIAGSNSPSELSGEPIRDLLLDEIDRYKQSAGKEGDPISLAEQRTRNFWNRTVFKVSSPAEAETSRILPEFLASDQRYYFVPCPHCGEFQVLKWKVKDKKKKGKQIGGVHWDKVEPEHEGQKPEHRPDTACYVCQHCAGIIEEQHRPEMLARGEWRPMNPKGAYPGFHISALYSPFVTFVELVKIFLAKKGSRETLKTFINLQLGEAWEERDGDFDPDDLKTRVEVYPAEVPYGVGVLTAGVDVQDDRLELLVKGWGANEESWMIGHHRFYGSPLQEQVWRELFHELTRKYLHESGRELKIQATMIDSGFRQKKVFSFVKGKEGKHRIYASKGADGRVSESLTRAKRHNRSMIKPWTINTHEYKKVLFGRLKFTCSREPSEEEVGGYMHFCPASKTGGDAEFYAQYGAEAMKLVRSGRRMVWVFEPTRERNEAIDLEVYASAALHSMGDVTVKALGLLAEKLVPVEKKEGKEKEQDQKRAAPKPRRRAGGWAKGWK